MKVDEATINHNAVRIITDLTEENWDMIDGERKDEERGYFLMNLGEIRGVCLMAQALKEVLKT